MTTSKGLYVEARIRVDMDELWDHTQDPALHQRWDLRFGSIEYLPKASQDEPQHFRYATRLLPGLTVAGAGISAGEKRRPDGTQTSALRFSSPHPLSLLKEGSGYWRYVPDGDGVRFLTGYDYTPRWGRFGRAADRCVFRPLMGWATAWSFDRLRLWLEEGITPRWSLVHWLTEMLMRALLLASLLGLFVVFALQPMVFLLASGYVDFGVLFFVFAIVGIPSVLAALLLRLPPLPFTPAARRCARTPDAAARAPRLLTALPQENAR
ncbi:hypothetical protein H9Y04_02235 [Streptomyces sp. TRM66268-LWL]|uniref:Membrane protein YndG n=1 Tax=Streptomyces polyasparticus TaxID=2767826 RepID=A0ABR7S8T6_9ACTN|nr:hypothetical protein [Streptomyces polyasparticus]MBC9711389.1 hypothetical protein [Streptomyces polyasparticus]